MNQKIFEMGLSTEAVSLYLLCCHLEDTMTPVSMENIKGLWNGNDAAMREAIDALQSRRVLVRNLPATGGSAIFRINGSDDWTE